MAFTVEDGTGKADANSYITIAFADSYFLDRAVAAWTGADSVKQAALIKATDFIDARWGKKFLGVKQFPTVQALQFPRTGKDNDGNAMDDLVPVAVQKACAEYALRALSGELAPDPTVDASGRQVLSSRRKVGPIETETSYSTASVTGIRPYPAADMLLRSVVRVSTGVIRC